MTGAPPRIFDRTALARSRLRAARMKHDRFLLRESADGIVARLAPINQKFARALEIEPVLAAPAAFHRFAACWIPASLSDEETLATEETGFDLAVSALGLHHISDLPGLLIQIRQRLRPDGLFVAALFGGTTLIELREALAAAEIEQTGGASPRISPMSDVRDLGNLLQRAGFALPVADVERTTVLYSDITKLIEDLRAHGQSNALVARQAKPLSQKIFQAAAAYYAQNHAETGGRLRATFDIIYLMGFAPAQSQPRALRPGSANNRLADVLGTTEISAGEKVAFPDKGQT